MIVLFILASWILGQAMYWFFHRDHTAALDDEYWNACLLVQYTEEI